jgi:hypothetical protein
LHLRRGIINGGRQIAGDALRRQDFKRLVGLFSHLFQHGQIGLTQQIQGGFGDRSQQVNRLAFPDYSGNNMFNTLGNLAVNPKAGLLFVDFERGSTLQLSGQATIIWEESRVREFRGAERVIEFRIEQVVELAPAQALRWQLVEYSDFNP